VWEEDVGAMQCYRMTHDAFAFAVASNAFINTGMFNDAIPLDDDGVCDVDADVDDDDDDGDDGCGTAG
jgi:hypothetical protein